MTCATYMCQGKALGCCSVCKRSMCSDCLIDGKCPEERKQPPTSISADEKIVAVLKELIAQQLPQLATCKESVGKKIPEALGLAEQLMNSMDKVNPTTTKGSGGSSRFEFNVECVKDPGQPDYFSHMPDDKKVLLEQALLLANFSGYCVCNTCEHGITKGSEQDHMNEHHAGIMQPVRPMDAQFVVRAAEAWKSNFLTKTGNEILSIVNCANKEEAAENLAAIHVYTMQTPLCYQGNAAMRSVTGDDRNPF
eukprot:PhF_6_TR14709/c0_g1_i1/m.23146